jgi:hypothetical protein
VNEFGDMQWRAAQLIGVLGNSCRAHPVASWMQLAAGYTALLVMTGMALRRKVSSIVAKQCYFMLFTPFDASCECHSFTR